MASSSGEGSGNSASASRATLPRPVPRPWQAQPPTCMPDLHLPVLLAQQRRQCGAQLAAHVERGPLLWLVHKQHSIVPGRGVGRCCGRVHGRGHDQLLLLLGSAAVATGTAGLLLGRGAGLKQLLRLLRTRHGLRRRLPADCRAGLAPAGARNGC